MTRKQQQLDGWCNFSSIHQVCRNQCVSFIEDHADGSLQAIIANSTVSMIPTISTIWFDQLEDRRKLKSAMQTRKPPSIVSPSWTEIIPFNHHRWSTMERWEERNVCKRTRLLTQQNNTSSATIASLSVRLHGRNAACFAHCHASFSDCRYMQCNWYLGFDCCSRILVQVSTEFCAGRTSEALIDVELYFEQTTFVSCDAFQLVMTCSVIINNGCWGEQS